MCLIWVEYTLISPREKEFDSIRTSSTHSKFTIRQVNTARVNWDGTAEITFGSEKRWSPHAQFAGMSAFQRDRANLTTNRQWHVLGRLLKEAFTTAAKVFRKHD